MNLLEHNLDQKHEQIILKLLKREESKYIYIWELINNEMITGFNHFSDEMGLNLIKRRVLQLYWKYISRMMRNSARSGENMSVIEIKIARVMNFLFKDESFRLPYFRARAKRIYDRIGLYIQGTVLDMGCGDGILLSQIANIQGVEGLLGSDVIDYRTNESRYIPYLPYQEGEPIDLMDDMVDTSILWTVLHHSDDPEFLLSEVCRVTRHRIIICEGMVDDPITYQKNMFFDWFLNRPGKGEAINVPFNYKPVSGWTDILKSNNWESVHIEDIGIDEPSAPEHHVLIIAEPKKQHDYS